MSGIKLDPQDEERLKKSVENLSGRYKQQRVCRYCGDPLVFKPDQKNRMIPYDFDGTPHWRTCPYESMTQKRASFGILKKVAVYLSLKHPDLDIETEFGLTEKEGKVMHAVLEKVLREIQPSPVDTDKVEGDLTFKPEPTDPVGDPDEETAPDEELVKDSTPDDLVEKP